MQFVVHHEFTQTSRGFSKKRGFVFCREFRTKHPGTFFLKQEKVGFKSLAQLTSYIYNRFEMENCCLTGQVLS